MNYNNLERRRTAGVRIKPRAPNRKQKLSMTTRIKSKVLRQSLPPGSEQLPTELVLILPADGSPGESRLNVIE